MPEFLLEDWTTTQGRGQFNVDKLMALHADHVTHEHFHAAFKSDLDLEGLPLGKFDTNCLMRQLATLAIAILRLSCQCGWWGRTHRFETPPSARG